MNDVDTHTKEYQEIRTRLFNLNMQLAVEGRRLSDEDLAKLKEEIKQAKKDLASYAFHMKENEKNGGIQK